MQLLNLIVFFVISLCHANAQQLIKNKDIGSAYRKVDFTNHDENRNQQSYGFFKSNEIGLKGRDEDDEEGIKQFHSCWKSVIENLKYLIFL